ncbi:hypothetical protein MTO98_32720 [Mucilaginibacter sp. SMC90]|uniref:hypothetical protein n=1 Tax=Mucilaginibacter sp. SMC90 TaxID=2929803 RepID=UPI001FB1F6C8|nr:hypothetical protein [Mucilaginibacter sp. SMC90]UOE49160.1 hypothetical protein MTO98_32720 [Mucilaginibacter sp. SMC90]
MKRKERDLVKSLKTKECHRLIDVSCFFMLLSGFLTLSWFNILSFNAGGLTDYKQSADYFSSDGESAARRYTWKIISLFVDDFVESRARTAILNLDHF